MLAEQNFDLDKVIIIQPESGKDILWSTEQCLKSGVCHSIVIWHNHLSVAQVKRLQLAAEQGNGLLFTLRSSPTKHVSLPVTLGLTLNPAKAGIKIHITKRRGTWPSAAININMQAKWPELCKPEISQRNKAKVIDFPSQIHCVS